MPRRNDKILWRVFGCLVILGYLVPYIQKKYQESLKSFRQYIVYGRGAGAFVIAATLQQQGHSTLLVMPQRETILTHFLRGPSGHGKSISIPYHLRLLSDPLRVTEPTTEDLQKLSHITGLPLEKFQRAFSRLVTGCPVLESSESADNYVNEIIASRPGRQVCFLSQNEDSCSPDIPSTRAYYLSLFQRYRYPQKCLRGDFLLSYQTKDDQVICTFSSGSLRCSRLIICEEFISRWAPTPPLLGGSFGYSLSETFPSRPFSKVVHLDGITIDLYHNGNQMTISVSELIPYLYPDIKPNEVNLNCRASSLNKRLHEIIEYFQRSPQDSVESAGLLPTGPVNSWKFGPLPGNLHPESLNLKGPVVILSGPQLPITTDPLRNILLLGTLIASDDHDLTAQR